MTKKLNNQSLDLLLPTFCGDFLTRSRTRRITLTSPRKRWGNLGNCSKALETNNGADYCALFVLIRVLLRPWRLLERMMKISEKR